MGATYKQIVVGRLFQLKLNDSFNIEDFLIEHWGKDDYFVRRSFDVYLCKAKKEFPVREFKVNKGIVKRIK